MNPIIILKRNLEIVKVNDDLLKYLNIKNRSELVRRKVKYLNIDKLTNMLADFVNNNEDIVKSRISHSAKDKTLLFDVELVKLYKYKKQFDFVIIIITDSTGDTAASSPSVNRYEELSVLYDLSNLGEDPDSFHSLFEHFVEKMMDNTFVEMAAYFYFNPADYTVNKKFDLINHNAPKDILEVIQGFLDASDIKQYLEDKPILFTQTNKNKNHLDQLMEKLVPLGVKLLVYIPINIKSETIGAILFLSKNPDSPKLISNLPFFDLITMHLSSMVERFHLFDEIQESLSERDLTKKDLENQFKLAKGLKWGVMTINFPNRPEVDFAVKYIPSFLLGGDFYEVFEIDEDHIGVFLADVCGQGVTSAMINSFLKSTVRERAQNYKEDPSGLLADLNKRLIEFLPEELFVSAVYMIVDFKKQQVLYSNAGHPKPYYYNSEIKKIEELASHDPLMAVFPTSQYHSNQFSFHKQDRILLYTDGAYEAKNIKTENFDRIELKTMMEKHLQKNTRDLLETMMQELFNSVDINNLRDDINFIAIDFH